MRIRKLDHILVTGGAGFIGSSFVRFLLRNPSFQGKITNLDMLNYAANLDRLEDCLSDPRHLFMQGNICDRTLLEKILASGVDAIVHFAAETHVDRSIVSSEPFLQSNVLGTASLMDALRQFPSVHFHHVSTDEVYGSLGKTGFFNEESMYHPNSPYSASKAASDHIVRAFAHTYQLSYTISHCSNNYGPYQFPEKFIPLMIQNCLLGKELPIYGSGSNVRDWLFVDDHAEAIWKILQLGKKGETYDIGGDTELSNVELLSLLIEALAEETHKDPSEYRKLIRFVSDRPGHDFRYAIDSSKIKRELGWRAQVSLKEGLRKTIRSFLGEISPVCTE